MPERIITPANPWLVKIAGPSNPTHRIIAFPNAGGTASSFRAWGTCLPAVYELLGLQLPGRQKRTREKPLRELRTALEQMLPAIAALPPCPTTFVGDCMGAIIAYEVIRTAAAKGLPLPERLVVSACHAPHLRPRRRDMHALPEDDLIADIKAHALAPAWLMQDAETFRSFLPLLRCDYEMGETYRHQSADPIDVPITAFTASEDIATPRDDISEWCRHTSKQFELIDISGGHDIATAQPEAFLRHMLGSLPSNASA